MYTVPAEDDPAADDGLPAAESGDELDDGALGYTSYCVAGYTTPRI
jgi:hypothetical protein